MDPSWFDARTWIAASKPILSRVIYHIVLSVFLFARLEALMDFQATMTAVRVTRSENCSLTTCYNNAISPD
jgi:hypothetical protein